MTQAATDTDTLILEKLTELSADISEMKSDITAIKISQARTEGRLSSLETNLTESKAETATKFSDLKSEMDSRFTNLKSEMDSKFSDLKSEMDSRFSDLKSEMDSRFSDLKEEIKASKSETNSRFSELREDIRGTDKRLWTLIVGAVLALFGLLAKMAFFPNGMS